LFSAAFSCLSKVQLVRFSLVTFRQPHSNLPALPFCSYTENPSDRIFRDTLGCFCEKGDLLLYPRPTVFSRNVLFFSRNCRHGKQEMIGRTGHIGHIKQSTGASSPCPSEAGHCRSGGIASFFGKPLSADLLFRGNNVNYKVLYFFIVTIERRQTCVNANKSRY